jgi:hypothetical protein
MDTFSTVAWGIVLSTVNSGTCCILPEEYEDEEYMIGISPQDCPQV